MHAAITAREAIRAIPQICLERSHVRSVAYLVRDGLLFVAIAWLIVAADTWFIALPLSLLLGTVLTGLFVIGHDAGHRSFANQTWINDAIGEMTTPLALWPFHVWRLSHDLHHRHTHNIERDIAWIPFTTDKLAKFGPIAKKIYIYTRTMVWFVASWSFTYYFIRDAMSGRGSKYFRQDDMPALNRSLIIFALVQITYVAASFYVGSWYGFFFLWLLPQTVFQAWLSTFTLLHHTHPDETFVASDDWTFEVQLRKTVHVDFPRWVEWLTHDINVHVPHHACVGVPHYRLKEAHVGLRAAFPFVREERVSWRLIKSVLATCQLITGKDAKGLAWIRFDQAVDTGLMGAPSHSAYRARTSQPS